MTYKVIARKCRPQTFDEVIGQKHVTRTLSNAIRDNRVAHAFLFTGERGVGKTSVARILAKALNCHSGPTDHPCGSCPSCVEITAGNAIDVHEIDGASNTGVDDIRVLRENVRYMPSRDRYKIYIIDEVHMLSTSAFNALLKTLEEPPGHVIFIFATTEPHKIPDTILSRCLRFDFKRIPLREIMEHLARIAENEHIAISNNALFLIAREAEGSMRDAQTILERAIAYCGAELTDTAVEEMLGHVDRQFIYRIMDALLAADPQGCIDGLADVHACGVDLKQFYYSFTEQLRNLMMVRTIDNYAKLIEAPEEDMQRLKEFAARISQEELLRCFRLWLSAEAQITKTAFPRIALEVCFLEMIHLKRSISADELLARIDSLQKQLRGYSPELSATVSRAEKSAPHVRPTGHMKEVRNERADEQVEHLQASGTLDEGLLAFIRKQNAPLASYLAHAHIEMPGDGAVTIAFAPGDFFMNQLKEPETEKKLLRLCETFLGRQVRLSIEATREKKNELDRETREQVKQKREQQALHNPVVQQVLKTFNGRIVEIRKEA